MATVLAGLGERVSLAEVVARIGGHPNAARAHLDALVEVGLARTQAIPRTGPGRPALGWTLTESGRRAVAGDPSAATYAEVLSVVVSHLAEVPGSEGIARAIGRSWGLERVEEPSRPAMIELLRDLGFGPEIDGESIRLRTCPILDVAREHPRVVCAIHAGLVAGASGDDRLRLVPFAQPGACRIDPT